MRSTKARVILGLAGLLLASAPVWAQDEAWRGGRSSHSGWSGRNEFRLWLGGFRPDESSAYWRGVKNDFTPSDNQQLQDVIFGGDYILHVTPNVGIMFSGSYYQSSTTQFYRNFTEAGSRVNHDQSLDIGSFTAGAIFHFAPEYPVNPYVGAGGGAYFYRLREAGDFINFNDATLPIFTSSLSSSGTAFGYYLVAGVDFRVGRTVSLFAEGRYSKADKELSGDFAGFGKIDLSGKQLAGGISWHLR